MKDLLPIIDTWTQENRKFTISRVVKTWGSSPRPIGSTMLVDSQGNMAGSVSGGCVEGAVVKASPKTLQSTEAQYLNYGVTDEEAWTVGLSCGGKIQVFQQLFMACREDQPENELWKAMHQLLKQNKDFILVTPLKEGMVNNTLITPDGKVIGAPLESSLIEGALEAYKSRNHQTIDFNSTSYFIHLFPRKSQLLIIGSAHITADLVTLGQSFGFETIVIDPRGVFAHNTHYETKPDLIIEEYPSEVLNDFILDANSYAVILSHDPKIDDNALLLLLPSDVAYIGALGSRKTHAKRVQRLLSAGFKQEVINKIKAPIGLSIGAKTPREIALSIISEIIATKNGNQ